MTIAPPMPCPTPRIGIDLGGTKIEGIVLDGDGAELARKRIATPRDDYGATLEAIAGLAVWLAGHVEGELPPVGLGIPGSVSAPTGRVRNANSTWLNGRELGRDLAEKLGAPVRIANDANCFALSEATDGTGAKAATVFGVILGTGVGGGIVINGRVLDGPLGIAGEWGHNPLPWASSDEHPGPLCWCGRLGCMETWVSGPALAADYARATGDALDAEAIVQAAGSGSASASAALTRHADRLARGLSHIVNVIDPDVIVLGGGLSKLAHLYEVVPGLMRPHIFAYEPAITILPPRWGDASGVRGAAWLAGT